jgi:hypothetical protein
MKLTLEYTLNKGVWIPSTRLEWKYFLWFSLARRYHYIRLHSIAGVITVKWWIGKDFKGKDYGFSGVHSCSCSYLEGLRQNNKIDVTIPGEIQTVVSRFYLYGATAPSGSGPPHYRGFTITLKHATLGRSPLDEWSARRRDVYLTTHNTHKRQTSMPQTGFEPTIPASKRLQTHTLDRGPLGSGASWLYIQNVTMKYINLTGGGWLLWQWDESFGCIKVKQFFDQLNAYHILNKDSAS